MPTRAHLQPGPLRPFLLASLLVALAVAGCAAPPAAPGTTGPAGHPHCEDQPFQPRTLHFAPGRALANATPDAGEEAADGAGEAFAAAPRPWLSAPVAQAELAAGNVTFDLWLRFGAGVPAASPSGTVLVVMQFGSTEAFSSGSARHEIPVPTPGQTVRVNASLPIPPGGFPLEAGEGVRVLVTVLHAGPQGSAALLVGGDTPSHLRYEARCQEERAWVLKRDLRFPVILPGNQGGPSQAVPPQEGLNRLTVPFDLEVGASRLTIRLEQPVAGRARADMDVYLLGPGGDVRYEAASPFANETMLLGPGNLAAFLPPGPYKVRIDAYGGANYSGKLAVIMHESDGHLHA